MDLQQTSKDDGKCPEMLEDGVEMSVDGWNVESRIQEQSSSGPGLPRLSRCAACYNHKKNFLYGGDGESSSSAGDSGPEVDCESISSSSSSSVEEDEPEKPPSPAGAEDGGKEDEEEVKAKTLENLAEGTMQTAPQNAPVSSVAPQPRPSARPDTVVSTLRLQVLPQEHASDTFHIIRQQEEETEEHGEEGGGACHLPPQMGWSHPPSQQYQLPYHHQQQQQQYLQAYQMFPQRLPLFPVQGQRLPPALHTPPVLHWPAGHSWPQAPSAAQAHLDTQVPNQCWCCSNRGLPPFDYQNKYGNW